jgi:co-chaperonin GroES (HSP10)
VTAYRIAPTKNRVIVREEIDHNPGGQIVIVSSVLPTLCTGRVLAVGPGATDIHEGDTVHYQRRFGRALPDDCLLLEYDMIEAVSAQANYSLP